MLWKLLLNRWSVIRSWLKLYVRIFSDLKLDPTYKNKEWDKIISMQMEKKQQMWQNKTVKHLFFSCSLCFSNLSLNLLLMDASSQGPHGDLSVLNLWPVHLAFHTDSYLKRRITGRYSLTCLPWLFGFIFIPQTPSQIKVYNRMNFIMFMSHHETAEQNITVEDCLSGSLNIICIWTDSFFYDHPFFLDYVIVITEEQLDIVCSA